MSRDHNSTSVLVTGGAGFIGSHLVDALCAAGHHVRVIDNFSTGRKEHIAQSVELVIGDLTDRSAVDEAVDGIEVVLHQAALGSVPRSLADPVATEQSNVVGSIVLLEAARHAGVRRIVAASSSSVYGGAVVRPISEDVPPNPRSPYAVSKYAMERYLRVYAETHQMETLALRYFNVFGPRQASDSDYAAVLPRWAQAILNGLPPVIFGDGLQSRDFTFVNDVVRANLRAMAADAALCDGRAYNIAGGTEHALLDVVAMFGRILDVSVEPLHEPPRVGDVKHSAADITRAAHELDWVPQTPMEVGLRTYIEWLQDGPH